MENEQYKPDVDVESTIINVPIKLVKDSPYMKSVEEECEDLSKDIPKLTRTSSTPISSRETTPTESNNSFMHASLRMKRFTPPLNRCFSISSYPSAGRQYGCNLSPLSFNYLMQAAKRPPKSNGLSDDHTLSDDSISSTPSKSNNNNSRKGRMEKCKSFDESSKYFHPDSRPLREINKLITKSQTKLDIQPNPSNENIENTQLSVKDDLELHRQSQLAYARNQQQRLPKHSSSYQTSKTSQPQQPNNHSSQMNIQELEPVPAPSLQRPPISHHLPSQLPKPRLYTLSATTATATPSVHSMRRERYFSRRTISDQGPQHQTHLWGNSSPGLWGKRKDPKRTSAPSMTNTGNGSTNTNGSTCSTNVSSPSSSGSTAACVRTGVFLRNRKSWPAQPMYKRRYVN